MKIKQYGWKTCEAKSLRMEVELLCFFCTLSKGREATDRNEDAEIAGRLNRCVSDEYQKRLQTGLRYSKDRQIKAERDYSRPAQIVYD